jgi:hypothetical protein
MTTPTILRWATPAPRYDVTIEALIAADLGTQDALDDRPDLRPGEDQTVTRASLGESAQLA